ncbi:MAG: hypothetical protein IIV03_06280, partial [Clostridia bacterium]|nr:hypothetical protein [Clostridia bacterium]
MEATNASVTLDGTNPGSVTVSLIGNADMDVYAIEGDWDTQDSAGKLTLSAITTDVSNVKFTGMNYVDALSGKVLWTDDTFSAPAVLSDGTRFLNATYTVAADTPSGTYTVSFRTEVLTATDYNSYQDETYYTATITVTRPEVHVCSGIPTDGQDATCTTDGWQDYYSCSCGKFYADSACTTLIADLDAWKAEGGNGYIKANGHSFNNKASDTVATVATCQAPATYYVQCDNCTVTTTEKTVTKDDVKDSTNHTSQVIVYKNKTASTHDEYYACCDALKAAAVAHNYDSVTHACVCGAEKHTHAKYDNDANGHWSVCSCGKVLSETERHVPGAPADEYNNQICTVCEKILVNALGHQHNLHLVHKTALNPTCTEAGHKEYWQCDGCAETPCFEDANGTVVIADLAAWKAEGGNGYIKANGHSFTTLSSGVLATSANCQNPATYYVLCDNCNEHSTDKTIALDDVLNMNNHVSDKVVYKNVTETTHDEHYKCCDTLKTAAVAHQYDSTTHACVCGAEKHVHAKYEYNKDCHWSVCSCGEVLSVEADHDNDGELCEICGCVYHTCGGKEMTRIPEVPATCDDDGVKAYYECSCHKLYADKDAKTEITDLDAWKAGDGKIPAGCKYVTEYGYAATCTKDGLTDYVYCSVCKTVYSAATVIPGGHDWSAWVIVKIVDGVKYLERSCACGEHQEITSTPEHKHDLIKVDAVEATCETEGNIEYFYCQYCDWVEVAGGVASNLLAVKTPAA